MTIITAEYGRCLGNDGDMSVPGQDAFAIARESQKNSLAQAEDTTGEHTRESGAAADEKQEQFFDSFQKANFFADKNALMTYTRRGLGSSVPSGFASTGFRRSL